MNREAMSDISDDTILDEAHDCHDCATSRLVNRLTAMVEAQDESRRIKDERIAFLEAQVAELREELAGVIRGTR